MVATLFKNHAADSLAIKGPSQAPMAFGELSDQIVATVQGLNSVGVGRNDRVAMAIHDGPLAAAAFLGVASGATAAPLNPNLREEDFEFSLTDLEAKCLVVGDAADTLAIGVANRLSIPVITLKEIGGIAGQYTMYTDAMDTVASVANGGFSNEDDVALVLHTSGTTGKPKTVPLSLGNISESAGNIAKSMAFTPDDVGVGIVPLSHIHGIMGSIVAPLSAGGSVSYMPQFAKSARKIIDLLDEAQPTWITAVPTTHGAILTQAARSQNKETFARIAPTVRAIRSASSPLPLESYKQLQEMFPNAKIVESLAMTENAHSIFSGDVNNPATLIPGTVGVSVGPEVAVMDPDSKKMLSAGEVGELVIRGDSVMKGYYNNPDANESAFTADGWFRTGDLVSIDENGVGKVHARIKEMLKPGGEQVAPAEVDNALMEHPAVGQAMTFGIPDQKWGEIVASAVVLKEDQMEEPDALRDALKKLARENLAAHKVPKKIVFIDEIPKGKTGKPDRLNAASILREQGVIDYLNFD